MKEEDYINQSWDIDGVHVDLAQTHCGMNPAQLCDPKSKHMMTTHAFTMWYRIDGGEWKGGMSIKMDQYAADILNAWKAKQ